MTEPPADIRCCDFCDAAASYLYECVDIEEREQWWVTCEDCSALLEARDLVGLIDRAIETLPGRIRRWNHVSVMREQLQATYSRVLRSLRPRTEPAACSARREESVMNRATLTARYLDEVNRRDISAKELLGTLPESEALNFFYGGRYLSRPLFLGDREREQLSADLVNLRSALVSLPNRLYGGDLAAFARAVGANDVQVSAIMRSRGAAVTKQLRADLYIEEGGGFRLLEFNMGSALGGMDNADMCRALLEHPVLAEFADAHDLEYVDTMVDQVDNYYTECGFAPAARPMVACTDWPSSYQTLEPYMRAYNARVQQMGLDEHACHIGQLEVRDGRVWLGDRAVDIIDRLFMIEDLLESPEAAALMDPILDAAARGEVKIYTPMDSGIFSSKGALAMLSDEANRSIFDPQERASLDRILPWTRMVRPGPVTLEDGRRVDLLEYALANRHDLALKPTLLHGGQGVLLGWGRETTEQAWDEQVRAAVDGPYVLQRRIRPQFELFPSDSGQPVPWIVCWGAFTTSKGYGGVFARASSVESNVEVINTNTGAYVGSCLHAKSAAAMQ